MQKRAWRARPEQAPARRRSVRTSECYLLMPKNPLLWRVRLRARGRRFRSDAKWEALSDLESARWWKHGTRRVDGTGRAYRSFWRMGRSSLSGRTGTLLTGSRRGRNFAPSARSDGTEFCFCTLHASGQSKYSESCDGSSSRERKGPAWSFGLICIGNYGWGEQASLNPWTTVTYNLLDGLAAGEVTVSATGEDADRCRGTGNGPSSCAVTAGAAHCRAGICGEQAARGPAAGE